uniref:Uncharacterized protein n=1 Tax=Heterorhabditis bacteriophora TaxID=37862 RepID=A0A1I7WV23_HETBA
MQLCFKLCGIELQKEGREIKCLGTVISACWLTPASMSHSATFTRSI